MKTFKQKLALFLTVLLMMPAIPTAAVEYASGEIRKQPEGLLAESVSANVLSIEETETFTLKGNGDAANKVVFNTEKHDFSIVDASVSANVVGDDYFGEDGSYTINIPEDNPFFPYEVQFKCDGKVTNEWFMTPDDSVEIGGHTFYVSAYFDNTIVTQMSLNVAGDTVIVYPEEKEFTNDSEIAVKSLLPLKERRLNVDLSDYTPVELTMVSVDSIFTGENALADKSKVIWTYRDGDDDYRISETGDTLNLSYGTANPTSTTQWEMITGDDNQLAEDNIRYLINLQVKTSKDWLIPTIYFLDEEGNRKKNTVISAEYSDLARYVEGGSRYGDGSLFMYVSAAEMQNPKSVYMTLKINPSVFSDVKYDHFIVYEAVYFGSEVHLTDITDMICNTDAGYWMSRGYNDHHQYIHSSLDLVMATYDKNNNLTGWLPLYCSVYTSENWIKGTLVGRDEGGEKKYVSSTTSYSYQGSCHNQIFKLNKGNADNDIYYLTLQYRKASFESNSVSDVIAAYAGKYSSIAEAEAAGAKDIKETLFNSKEEEGYAADYSKGVYFTIFVKEDEKEDQGRYCICIKTEEDTALNSGTSVWFDGIKNANRANVNSYIVKDDEDSYGERNYPTILVDGDADLSNLAPTFSLSAGAKLFAAGSSIPEVSGESVHDFTKGPVAYTVSAENGKNSKNYWLQVRKAVKGRGQLYINSLEDADAHTRVENGIIYSTREVILDSYHDYVHDILLTNIGTEPIPALSAELDSDVVELDDYWTLDGTYGLAGFSTTDRMSSYGELSNLAKMRIRAKDRDSRGIDVSGTLTIKSGTETLMVLSLTGTIGDPVITTKEIPQAVKYVPYGTMIQNNNKYQNRKKYSGNEVSYSLISGTLPAGMEIKPNGEIYGVPGEAGEFTFTVRLSNSNDRFYASEMTYTLSVLENTDANVEAATDTGYELTQRVQNPNTSQGSQTLISQGEYTQFEAVYLDGVKLAEGTDYTSESGSTRITIRNQTLTSVAAGTHTLGIEFRTQDTGMLKRAAQNYSNNGDGGNNINDNNTDSGNNSGNNNNGTGGNSTNRGGSNSSNNNEIALRNNGNTNIVPSASDGTAATFSYTIQEGDTLWTIAEKYYGSGQYWKKIFEDNKDVISDPDKIYVGQVIVIILEQGDGSETIEGTSYAVQSGDTLYKIAKEFYGKGWKWRKIYSANKDIITTPEHIYVGQVIIIPEG